MPAAAFPTPLFDYPFDDPIAVARRRSSRKWFAVLLGVHGRVCVNLKCEPERRSCTAGYIKA